MHEHLLGITVNYYHRSHGDLGTRGITPLPEKTSAEIQKIAKQKSRKKKKKTALAWEYNFNHPGKQRKQGY